MNKGSRFGMAFHQALGFSTLLMKIPAAEAVFWPGCALLTLDGKILEKTLEILRRAEPEMQLAYGCCGQPTVYLFPEKTDKRREKLVRLLRKQGVKRIYTACPNCTLQLREIPGFEIIPVWPVLAAHIRPEDITSPPRQLHLARSLPHPKRAGSAGSRPGTAESLRLRLHPAGAYRL